MFKFVNHFGLFLLGFFYLYRGIKCIIENQIILLILVPTAFLFSQVHVHISAVKPGLVSLRQL